MNAQLKQLFSELLAEGYDPEEALKMISSGSTGASNLSIPSSSKGTGLLGRFSLSTILNNLKDPNKPLIGGNFNMPDLKGLGSSLRAKQLWEGGPKFSTAANTLSGIYQGGKALKGLYENTQKDSNLESIKNDINLQLASNPMYDMYLDANDERTLREMRNGTLNNNWAKSAEGAVKGIPQAALSALIGGFTGGIPGALIGGLGSLGNSAIQGYGQGSEETASKLQGLYGRLKQADEEYRSMKRPSGLRRAGLSTQYFNQLY